MRRVRILIGLIAAILIVCVLPVRATWAHAKLVRADPKPGSTVTKAPKAVHAWFNDELDPRRSRLTVVDRAGKRVDDGKGGVDLNDLKRKSMVVNVATLRPGTYTVRWTAVSADDGYVAKGSFKFTVAAPKASGGIPVADLPASWTR